MSYLKLLVDELSNVKLDCEFWDVRIEDVVETQITSDQNEIISSAVNPSVGAFIRVRKNGFWLYQSTTRLQDIKNILLGLSKTDTPQGKSSVKYQHPYHEPFIKIQNSDRKFSDISIDEKTAVMLSYSALILKQPHVNSVRVRYKDIYKVKSYLNSVGTQFEFDFNQGGMNFLVSLKKDQNIFDDYKGIYGAHFSELAHQKEKLIEYFTESQAFLDAPAVEPGKYKVLMDFNVTGVFTHESFGHKSEADHMLGDESALEEWRIGKKIGADCLTIVDQGNFENTSGYCPIDDEGIPCQKNYLIKNGVLAGRLHSVETAHTLNEKPTGNGRAMNFEFEPIVRMTSTYIEAGTDSLETLIQKSTGALLVEGHKHGSGLSTFTIAPNRGYIIQSGGHRKPVRVAVISGSVFETLKNIEAVSSEIRIDSGAVGGCGKGEQFPLPVAYGGPYILIKEMQVS